MLSPTRVFDPEALTSAWRVLIVGGSYAGLAAATNLLDQCEARPARFVLGSPTNSTPQRKIPVQITIVDERDGYYHLIGSPLALAEQRYASKAWVRFNELAALKHPAIRVIQGNVASVDCESMTAAITEKGSKESFQEPYDFLVAASGLRRVWPSVPQSLNRSEYLVEAQGHIDAVQNAKEGVVVIGGGAVGIEMAAELKAVQPSQMVTLIHSRARLLSAEPLPDDLKDKTASLLREDGVSVILGQRVTNISSSGQTSTLTLSNGAQLTTAHVISAISKPVPSTTYLPSDVLDPDGYVKISPSLNFPSDTPNYRHHFAVGDIAAWSGIKRCGAAMHMGHFASENIYQLMLHHQADSSSTPNVGSAKSHSAVDDVSTTPDSSSARSSSSSSPSISDIKPSRTLSQHPPMIGLALGKTAISYSPMEGTKWGEDVMQRMFGDDLGWSICWNYLQLGKEPPPPGKEGSETTGITSKVEQEEDEKTRRLSEEVHNAKAVVDVEGVITPSGELRRELELEIEKLRIKDDELRKTGSGAAAEVF